MGNIEHILNFTIQVSKYLTLLGVIPSKVDLPTLYNKVRRFFNKTYSVGVHLNLITTNKGVKL